MKLYIGMLIGLTCWVQAVGAESVQTFSGDAAEGKKTYQQLCHYCHKTNYDDKFGPGLGGVTERVDVAWLNVFLKDPHGMIKRDEYARQLKENNAYPLTMPSFSEMQDDKKRGDMIAYLKTLE